MRGRLIGEMWDSYLARAVPITADPAQRRETERAFYAGAMAVYEVIIMIGHPDIPEDAGESLLDTVARELAEYRAPIPAAGSPEAN